MNSEAVKKTESLPSNAKMARRGRETSSFSCVGFLPCAADEGSLAWLAKPRTGECDVELCGPWRVSPCGSCQRCPYVVGSQFPVVALMLLPGPAHSPGGGRGGKGIVAVTSTAGVRGVTKSQPPWQPRVPTELPCRCPLRTGDSPPDSELSSCQRGPRSWAVPGVGQHSLGSLLSV